MGWWKDPPQRWRQGLKSRREVERFFTKLPPSGARRAQLLEFWSRCIVDHASWRSTLASPQEIPFGKRRVTFTIDALNEHYYDHELHHPMGLPEVLIEMLDAKTLGSWYEYRYKPRSAASIASSTLYKVVDISSSLLRFIGFVSPKMKTVRPLPPGGLFSNSVLEKYCERLLEDLRYRCRFESERIFPASELAERAGYITPEYEAAHIHSSEYNHRQPETESNGSSQSSSSSSKSKGRRGSNFQVDVRMPEYFHPEDEDVILEFMTKKKWIAVARAKDGSKVIKVIPKGAWFSPVTENEKVVAGLKRALNLMKVLELTYTAEEKKYSAEALAFWRKGDKLRAKKKMAMKKNFQKFLEQLDGRKHNVSEVIRGFTNAELNKVTLSSMKEGSAALRQLQEDYNLDAESAEEIIDSVNEALQDQQEVSDVLAAEPTLSVVDDEKALEAELAELEQEWEASDKTKAVVPAQVARDSRKRKQPAKPQVTTAEANGDEPASTGPAFKSPRFFDLPNVPSQSPRSSLSRLKPSALAPGVRTQSQPLSTTRNGASKAAKKNVALA